MVWEGVVQFLLMSYDDEMWKNGLYLCVGKYFVISYY